MRVFCVSGKKVELGFLRPNLRIRLQRQRLASSIKDLTITRAQNKNVWVPESKPPKEKREQVNMAINLLGILGQKENKAGNTGTRAEFLIF